MMKRIYIYLFGAVLLAFGFFLFFYQEHEKERVYR